MTSPTNCEVRNITFSRLWEKLQIWYMDRTFPTETTTIRQNNSFTKKYSSNLEFGVITIWTIFWNLSNNTDHAVNIWWDLRWIIRNIWSDCNEGKDNKKACALIVNKPHFNGSHGTTLGNLFLSMFDGLNPAAASSGLASTSVTSSRR